VVATYRADDLHRQHPLRPLLAELRRNGRVRRVELAPFAAAEVAEYLAAATGSRPSPDTVAAVVDRTEGNAYFIEELIAADGLGGRPLPESFRIGPPPRSRRPCAGHDPPKAGPEHRAAYLLPGPALRPPGTYTVQLGIDGAPPGCFHPSTYTVQ
jgi:hypothetical protein